MSASSTGPTAASSPRRAAAARRRSTLLTYLDVTDSKKAERALIERDEALEAADRLKTAFISHVSYELRTPLTNIIGFSELLASPIAGPLHRGSATIWATSAPPARRCSPSSTIFSISRPSTPARSSSRLTVKVQDVIEAAVAGLRSG